MLRIQENFKIFKSDIEPKWEISYRLVLCHMVYKSDKTKDEILNDLKSVDEFVNQFNRYKKAEASHFYKNGIIEIYSINHEERQGFGFVVINRTKGCYPLVCFPEVEGQKLGLRVHSFQQAVKNIISTYNDLYPIIKKHDSWDKIKLEIDSVHKKTA